MPEVARTKEELILELHELREEVSQLKRDAKELRQAEKALRQSEKFLNNVFDSIQDGISVLDKDLNIVRVNHVLEKWHPYMMPIVGKKCYHAYHGRTRVCDVCPSVKALEEKTMQSAIVPLQGEAGEHRGWLEIFSFPLTDDEGNIIGVIEHVRDITERKRAEEYLRLTQFAMDKFSDSVIWLTAEGKIIYVNETACHSLGYSREELLSMHIWDIDSNYPPDKYAIEWQEAYGNGSKKFESQHKARDGRTFPVEVTSSFIRYGDKEYLITFDRDIAERKEAEDALWESERKFRAIFEGTFQFIGLLTVDGTLLDVNRPALELIEAAKSDLVGKPFWETPWCTYTPELREKIRDSIKKAAQGGFVRFETTIEAADGSLHHIDYSIKPMKDEAGKVILLIPEGRDITDLKRAEEALRESEEKFKVLAETSAAAIYVYKDERFVSVNQATERITGYSKDELLTMNFLDIIHPDFKALVLERSRARQRGEPATQAYEFQIVTKGGEVRWVEIRAGRIMYKGMPAGVATLFDITERKRAEKELEEAKNHAELYLDLMGHDINNMNQVGIGFLELALQSPTIQKQDKELLLKSLGSLENSSRLIGNVRKVQRARSGELKHNEVDVCQMILRVLAHYSNLPDIHVSFNYELPPYCPVMASDLVYEVFENLVGNAIKHGGEEPFIDVKFDATLLDGNKYNKFTVEDNGPGIPDRIKGHIFNRLQRGDTKVKGSGLGLYLVKSLVESYHGKVWVEDRVRGDHTKGARFIVMLPAVQ